MKVVIAGAGAIGCSCAYFLAQKGVTPIVIEQVAPACSSSGKAGGFIALDWNNDGALSTLSTLSYNLHESLADEHGGAQRWGYRKLNTHFMSLNNKHPPATSKRSSSSSFPGLPDWVATSEGASLIGTEATTAQVNPKLYTESMLNLAIDNGGELAQGKVIGVEVGIKKEKGVEKCKDTDGDATHATADQDCLTVTGVRVLNEDTGQHTTIRADAVIFAMGAWSSNITGTDNISIPVISGLKVHSIVVADEKNTTTPDALFLHCQVKNKSLEPEIYPRPDGTVYMCGWADEEAQPPERADLVEPSSQEAIDTLKQLMHKVVPGLQGSEVLQGQACFLPRSEDGLPVMGVIEGFDNAYVATGHGCWGILNAPGSGVVMAEMVVDGVVKCGVEIEAFDPLRFSMKKKRKKRKG